jgi:NADH-quinone oxidoreductase subunit N
MGTASVIFFVLVYVFSNLVRLALFQLLVLQRERIDVGLQWLLQNQSLAQLGAGHIIILPCSIPPTAVSLEILFTDGGIRQGQLRLILIAALNMIVSLYYYLKVAGHFHGEE